jgi:hypothetical protein
LITLVNLIILAYIDLRKIDIAQKIAKTLQTSKNNLLLDSAILNMNIGQVNDRKK